MKRLLLAAGLLGLTSIAALAQASKPAEKPAEGRTLNAKMDYTAAGTVDAKHKIFVFVFDSPNFLQGAAMPIGVGSTAAKDGTATVSNISVSPVYISVCFDAKGGYDGMSGPPPSGSPLGVYWKTPGTPEPVKIEAGKTAEITISFDDSYKMP